MSTQTNPSSTFPVRQRTPREPVGDIGRAELTRRLLNRAAEAEGLEQQRLQDEVILLNTGLAESIARRYAGRAEEHSDITQVAYLGLVNAVRRFRPEKGIDFISFAMPTITGEIKRFFRDQGWTVRPPRRIQDLHRHITTATAGLSQTLGRTPTSEEIAAELDQDVREVEEALGCRSCYTPVSIDAPTRTEEGTSLAEVLGQDDASFERSEARTALQPLCRDLAPRDQQVLFLRFFQGWTQQEIAQQLGVTQMQVSRLLARILAHLRSRLSGADTDRSETTSSRTLTRREASESTRAARQQHAA